MPSRHGDEQVNDRRRRFLKASGAGAVSLAVAGCSGDGGDTPTGTQPDEETETTEQDPDTVTEGQDIPQGGTLVYGMAAKPDSPNVFLSGSVYSAVALDPVHEYGITSDPVTYDFQPWLFSDWVLKQRDSDTPVAHFKVREAALEEMQFGHGKELTLEDIRFSYEYVLEQEPGEFSGVVGNLDSISESDLEEDGTSYDFQLQFTQRVVTWPGTVGGVPILPKDRWTDDDGNQLNYQEFNPVDEYGDEVGLGPGVLTQFNPDTSMQVQFTNKDQWQVLSTLDWRQESSQIISGGPFLDQVNFTIFGSESAMTQAFLNDEIDTHYGSMKPSEQSTVRDADGKSLVNGFDSGFGYWAFNLRRQPLDDATFRQGLAFAFDHIYWQRRLNQNRVLKGDYPHSPGYTAARPETKFADDVDREVELLDDPSSEAFNFREAQAGVVDAEGIREFFTQGQVVSDPGEYVGFEFPGTLSGVGASQSESKYDYSFGEVVSEALQDEQGVDQEIRVDGQTIPEIMDGPLTIFSYPPQETPRQAKAYEDWAANLRQVGIPVEIEILSFNTMVSRVYNTEEFEIYPMGWGGTNPYGTSLYFFFHTDNADVSGDNDGFVYNSTGYGIGETGYDETLKEAYTSLDLEEATRLFAQANERIYLDQAYHTRDYDKIRWPMNSSDWNGYVGNVVDPGFASWGLQWNNIHQRE